MKYTRSHPSPEYVKAVELSADFHRRSKTFTGRHSYQSFPLFRKLIKEHNTHALVDWGCGKGEQLIYRDIRLLNTKTDTVKTVYPTWQEALGVDKIYMYDPCVQQYEKLPDHPYDALICTDVLEHIPPPDLTDWVVDQMFSYTIQWLYASIACFPGKKTLADGSLAHKAIMPFEWWVELYHEVGKRYPSTEWHLRLEVDVSPITHRYFYGKGELWEEREGFWPIFKPAQLETLTLKQQEEMIQAARAQRHAIDPRGFRKKYQ